MPESDAMSALIGAGLEQWILHTGNLFLHGFERLPDDGRTHTLGAEVAHFLYLHEIEEGIIFARRYQSRLLPGLKLARNEPKDTQQVYAAIAIHGDQLLSMIIRNLCVGMQVASWWKAVENRAKMAQKWWIFLPRVDSFGVKSNRSQVERARPKLCSPLGITSNGCRVDPSLPVERGRPRPAGRTRRPSLHRPNSTA